jgi:hypothetical protein
MKLLPTEKLFYNKYPYKVECKVPHAGCLGYDRHGFTYAILEKFKNKDSNIKVAMYPGINITAVNNPQFKKFAKAVEQYVQQQRELDIKIRTEGKTFSLFCADEKIINDLVKRVPDYIDTIYRPKDNESLEFLLNNNRKVLVNALPYEQYQYKITLRESIPSTDKERFWKWVNGKEHYHISKQTIRFLSGQSWYVQNPFFYCKTQGDTSMAALFLGTNIKHIQEFVVTGTLGEA